MYVRMYSYVYTYISTYEVDDPFQFDDCIRFDEPSAQRYLTRLRSYTAALRRSAAPVRAAALWCN